MDALPRTPEDAVRIYDEAFNTRDWDLLTRLVVPEMRVDDRRTGIASTLEGAEAHVANHRSWVELVPDVQGHSEILHAAGDRVTLWRTTYNGTDGYGNPIEVSILVVNEWTRGPEGALVSSSGAVFEDAQRGDAFDEFRRRT